MKYFLLLEKKYDEFPTVQYSVAERANSFHMIIKYIEDNNIKTVLDMVDFKPHVLGVGSYLVRVAKDEYIVYDVANTGIIRDYFEFCKINRVNIVEFDITDKISDIDDVSILMKELKLKRIQLTPEDVLTV